MNNISKKLQFFLLDEKAAITALKEAETIDNYINYINTSRTNSYARRSARYEPLQLSKEEYIQYGSVLSETIQAIKYFPPIKNTIKFVILHETADGGMPHTRPGNIICLPRSIFDLTNSKQQDVILHETIHIFQRENPIDVESFYKHGWGYIKSDVLPVEGERLNPDALDIYAWIASNKNTDAWIVRPKFLRQDAPKLRDVRQTFYNINTGEITTAVPPIIAAFFGEQAVKSGMEHPHEMMAYLWTKSLMEDDVKTPAEIRLKEWISRLASRQI
jgi:hypothetical protein